MWRTRELPYIGEHPSTNASVSSSPLQPTKRARTGASALSGQRWWQTANRSAKFALLVPVSRRIMSIWTGGSPQLVLPHLTAYPILLAYNMAVAFCKALVGKGWALPSLALTPPDELSYPYLRSLVGNQPKASKLPPLVSEFKSLACVPCASSTMRPVKPGENSAMRGVAPPQDLAFSNGGRPG